jgi:hypothetical protein
MDLTQVVAKIGEAKSVVGGILIIVGIAVSAVGIAKVPAQQRVIAEALEKHNATARSQTDETNRKLDVLICLQAKLDTPLRCVANNK